MVTTYNVTAQKAIDQALHATSLKRLGLDPLDVLNMAGDHLTNVRAWRWLLGATAYLKGRGNIDITDGTWTESSLRLTSSAGTPFADYTFIDGDTIRITSGTSAIQKRIEVASKGSSSILVLKESLSTAGDLTPGDIAGTLHTPTLELPTDCAHIDSIAGTTALVNSVDLVDHKLINLLRGQWDREDDTGLYRAAVIDVGTPPRPVLDVHPDFGSDIEDVFRINYLRTWDRVTQASQTLRVPRFCNAAFMQLMRHFALGWEDEDEEGLEARLTRWELGPVFMAAARQDGRKQKTWGKMRGGAIGRTANSRGANALSSEVGGPT